MREYVKIYCCGDCINYSLKRHKCLLGAKEEGEPREKFYRDCPLGLNVEEEGKQPSAEKHGEFVGTEFAGYVDGKPAYFEWKCSCCECTFEDENRPTTTAPTAAQGLRGAKNETGGLRPDGNVIAWAHLPDPYQTGGQAGGPAKTNEQE